LLEGFEFFGKGFLESLSFLLALAGGFGSQLFFLLPEVLSITF
jgi:hypothetical protein